MIRHQKDDRALVERVAMALRRERHRECCIGAALDDICTLPLREREMAEARAAIAAMQGEQP
jgi:hypothetical protein